MLYTEVFVITGSHVYEEHITKQRSFSLIYNDTAHSKTISNLLHP
jgi:hypothetical protein